MPPPKSPEEGYHLTTDLTDKAIEFIQDAHVIAPDKPFFLYYCPAAHAPHHVFRKWADRYRGQFDVGLPDSMEQNLTLLDELGSPRTYNHYPTGWAWAFNTPFKMWKRYGNLRGGTADPLIVSWPAGIRAAGQIRRHYCHAVDIVPTLCEALAVQLPEAVNGYSQKPLEGVSFAASFEDPSADTGKETQFYSMLGTRALWHRGWKASSLGPAAPNAWGQFSGQRWELFNTDRDPSECHDLAEKEPERLRELIDMWWVEAGKFQALPLETRNAVEAFTTPRPELSTPRTRYTYRPGGAEVPESQAPNIRGRSYTIAAEVDIDSADAGGVLFSQGSRFGGHALYVKDGKLAYAYNFVEDAVQIIESGQRRWAGRRALRSRTRHRRLSRPAALAVHRRYRQTCRDRRQRGSLHRLGQGGRGCLRPPVIHLPNQGSALTRSSAHRFCTSALIRASTAAVSSFSAKAVGPMAPSSRFAVSLKPNVAYLVLNFCPLWTKQTTLPSLAYAGIPYQVLGERPAALASMMACPLLRPTARRPLPLNLPQGGSPPGAGQGIGQGMSLVRRVPRCAIVRMY